MLYAFELSGEHEVLPIKEAYACMNIADLKFKEYKILDQCLIVDIDGNFIEIENKLQSVAKRCAMSHQIIRVMGISNTNFKDISHMIEEIDYGYHIPSSATFVVRAKKIKQYYNLKSDTIERYIGAHIFKKGYKVNLKCADVSLRLILGEKCVFGSLIASINRSEYEQRLPHKKPFFYPGVLMPRIARCIVNLSQVKKDEILFDPFCGTAGILVEGTLIGSHVIGIEMREMIAKGGKLNLDTYGNKYNIIIGDACRICLKNESVDAIVTDPPYGRSAAIKAESLHQLYSKSFNEMYRILKTKKNALIVSEIDVTSYAKEAGFEIVEQYTQRIHKSLTRRMILLYKNNV